jgi:microsomal dipeptidase-like Zn-dependent dipeptidase
LLLQIAVDVGDAGNQDRGFVIAAVDPTAQRPRSSEVIADALLKRGYKPRAVEKVLGSNFTDAPGRIWGE